MYVCRIRKTRNAHRIFVGYLLGGKKHQFEVLGKRSLGTSRWRLQNNVKMDIVTYLGVTTGVDWIELDLLTTYRS
jgi:hypothetical protein